MYEEMLSWLDALDGVEQDPRYHPEGDALFHSLQVFEHALASRVDAEMLAAALLHDIGKATAGTDHAEVGADMLCGLPGLAPEHPMQGVTSARVHWLVAHHLHLLRWPKHTRAWLAGTPHLRDLEALRRFDLAGRDPRARVRSPEEAVSIVIEAIDALTMPCGQGDYGQ